jgi:hypothetical protein
MILATIALGLLALGLAVVMSYGVYTVTRE